MSPHFHAVIWIDHSQARVFHIGMSGEDEIVLHQQMPMQHLHHKANTIGSGHAASSRKFFEQVVEAVRSAGQILIIGPSTAKTEFVRYLREQDKAVAERVVAIEAADHPSDGEIVAYAKKYFGMDPIRAGARTR
jgi:stalled ribosome rescue protein Dom34